MVRRFHEILKRRCESREGKTSTTIRKTDAWREIPFGSKVSCEEVLLGEAVPAGKVRRDLAKHVSVERTVARCTSHRCENYGRLCSMVQGVNPAGFTEPARFLAFEQHFAQGTSTTQREQKCLPYNELSIFASP